MGSSEIAVLVNPSAGRGRHRGVVPLVLERLGRAGSVRVLEAADSVGAERACVAAVEGGASALVAVGGDGTVHRGLQAVAGRPVGFGVVPLGTGNDFASCVGVPADPVLAADRVVAALGDGRSARVDLGRIGSGRWFGAVLAAGFDAVVNERANRMRWPRGARRYDLAILVELARLRSRHYVLELDGQVVEGPSVLVAVGNCASYGGGLRIVPDADPADGLLDVIMAEPLGRVALMGLKPRLRRGTHVRDPRVRVRRASRVTLQAEGIVAYADGERAGELPLTVDCVPGAARLLI